jgi:hypothetical protein
LLQIFQNPLSFGEIILVGSQISLCLLALPQLPLILSLLSAIGPG